MELSFSLSFVFWGWRKNFNETTEIVELLIQIRMTWIPCCLQDFVIIDIAAIWFSYHSRKEPWDFHLTTKLWWNFTELLVILTRWWNITQFLVFCKIPLKYRTILCFPVKFPNTADFSPFFKISTNFQKKKTDRFSKQYHGTPESHCVPNYHSKLNKTNFDEILKLRYVEQCQESRNRRVSFSRRRRKTRSRRDLHGNRNCKTGFMFLP